MREQWVIDATMGYEGGLFTFCPIEGDLEGDFTVITGMMFLSDEPPKGDKLVGIVHADGQDAMDAFCEEYAVELEALKEKLHGTAQVSSV